MSYYVTVNGQSTAEGKALELEKALGSSKDNILLNIVFLNFFVPYNRLPMVFSP